MTLGERLKEIRITIGLSIEEVARALKVSKNQVIGYEEDKHKPRHKTIAALAKLYGVLPSDLTDLNKQTEFVVDKQDTPMSEELRKAYAILTRLGYYCQIRNNTVLVHEVENPRKPAEINKKEFEKWLLDIKDSWKTSVANYLINSSKSKNINRNSKDAIMSGEKELFKYCGVDSNE